jgi:membrane-associated phospholipid phosphatase
MRPLLIAILLCALHVGFAQNADIRILRQANLSRNTAFDPFFTGVTASASPISMAAPSVTFIAGWAKRDTSVMVKGIYIASAMAVNGIVTTAMKYSIRRDRPFVTYPEITPLSAAGSPSFPSGHTSNAFATATAVTLAFPTWYVAAPAFAWAGAVGYSRMHLGVHYPSDVLVGAAVGAGSAWLCHWLNRRLFGTK